MSDYLRPLLPLLPATRGMEQACPLLWAQIYPYVRTLLTGGWFGWVAADPDPLRRNEDFRALDGDRPNSAFVNEVLVRCPNAKAEVLVGIGPAAFGQVLVRVLKQTGDCAFGHHVGQSLRVDASELPAGLAFARSLPGLLEAAYAPGQSSFSPCLTRADSPQLATETVAGPCRYHRGNETYPDATCWGGGLCPAALHAAYPQALAMYYGAARTDRIEAACPAGERGLTLSLTLTPRLPTLVDATARLAARLATRLLHPVDPLLGRLSFRIEGVGECPWGHAAGESFTFNLGRREVLCPASAYSIYPFARLSKAAQKGFRQLGGWDGLVCPDFLGAAYALSATR